MICFISINTSVVTLFLFAMLLIILACRTIISEKNGNHKLKWLIFVILFEIGIHFIVLTLIISGFITNIPFLSRGLIPFYFIYQPALYFFVVFNLDENYEFSKKDYFHLIPSAIAFIDNWGFYIGGPTHWKHWANLFSNDLLNLGKYPGILALSIFNYLSLDLLNITYTLFAWRYLIKQIQLKKELKAQFVLKWIIIFLIIISIFVISLAICSVRTSKFFNTINFHSNNTLLFSLFFVGVTIIALASFILFNPLLLHGLPKKNFNLKIMNDRQISKNNSSPIDNEKIETNEYKLAVTIITEIKEKELFRNTEFSMVQASEYFSIPIHHISFVINKNIKKSFPDIICEFRIDHAIKLLKDNRNKKYTMEAIGNLSGFNSRTTFYVSFKKITGISPNEYLQNLKIV